MVIARGTAADCDVGDVGNDIVPPLAYQAIAEGSIDVTDAYSTDGELERYDLKVLEDGIPDAREAEEGTDPQDPSSASAWHPEWTGHPRLLADASRWAEVKQAILDEDPDDRDAQQHAGDGVAERGAKT